ncbi:MAG: AAA family ATPase [Alphaproteobacteria bacterium]
MNILQFGKNAREVAQRISEEVPRDVQLRALIETFPNGIRRGNDFLLGSLSGEKGQSLRINIDTKSPWFLKGKDFESGDGVGGITKILKEGRGWSIQEVAEYFSHHLSKNITLPPENVVKLNKPENFQVTNTTATNGFQKPEQKIVKAQIGPNTPFEEEYDYTDENGQVLVTVRKYFERDETGEIVRDGKGKPKKQFRQFMSGGQGIPDPRPLYNIPDIVSADKVIWVEGEKCADALNELGYTATCTIGGAGMLSENTASKFDFTPLRNKDLILWPDNDEAGKKLAKIVEAQAKNAGAKSTVMLQIPSTKPEKWDAADAIEEDFNIKKFLKDHESKVKKPISLLDDSLIVDKYFIGAAPEQKFLIGNTIPLGVPVVFAAAGDSGKGMMTLDLAMKVASGASMQNAFGGLVAEHGDAIIITAEDDKDEMHRRISRLDPMRYRETYDHKLRVLPLPNLGGVFPIMQKFDNTYLMGEEFSRIYDQMLEMENLKLIVIDPLASFVHADVNADPAAGAAFMGLLAQMATETGATVMVNHHMAKVDSKEPISTPEEARNKIRGTSAIVDGVRSAFAVWQVDEGTGKQRCRDLNVPYTRNAVFDGAVVKSNGPANREIRHFIRNQDTGLLEDRSVDIQSLAMSEAVRERLDHVVRYIRMREEQGLAVTIEGTHDGVWNTANGLEPNEPCIIAIQSVKPTTIKNTITTAMQQGLVEKYRLTPSGPLKYLGVPNGPLSNGTYEPVTGRDNV